MHKPIAVSALLVLKHALLQVHSFSGVDLSTKEWVNVTLQISLLSELCVQMFLCLTSAALYRGKGLWLWFPLQN